MSQATEQQADPQISRPGLWFGLLGGAVAWLIHLVGAALVAEFGCVMYREEHVHPPTLLGLTTIAWIILVLSVFMLVLSIAATLIAGIYDRRLRRDIEPQELRQADRFMARTGWITSAVFVFVIAVQSIPVFYYLRDC